MESSSTVTDSQKLMGALLKILKLMFCSLQSPYLYKQLNSYIDMDSHCPEGAALFSALCFVWLLLTKYLRGPITGVIPKLWFVLNNKSVAEDDLEWTYGQETLVFDYLKSDYDLLQGIQREIETLPIASKVSWVKGHQD
jgi:hypothetical protein